MRLRFAALTALACCSGSQHAAPTGAVVATLVTAWHFVVDDDDAFVAGGNGQNGTGLVRVPLDGSATSMMVVGENISSLAMDQSSIYFTSGGSVARIDKSGGSPQPLGTSPADGVALDDGFVYWRSAHAIGRLSKDGGAEETIATAPTTYVVSFVVDETNVYWEDYPVAFDGGFPFATVWRVPKGGGAAESLATGAFIISPLAIDDAGVYWAGVSEGSNAAIFRFDKATSITTTLAQGDDCSGPESITTGASKVFWSGVVHVAMPGVDGGVSYVARSSTFVPDMHVRNGTIYWLEADYDAGGTNLRAIAAP